MAGTRLTFKPVTKARWADFEALFEAPGSPKYCWCMAWRPMDADRSTATNAVRKAEMEGRIKKNAAVGLLGFDGKEPVAWVSIAPKDTYMRLGGPKPEPGETVWSLACMFVRRAYRGQGLAHELIAAAVAEARKRRASVIEAYPVDPSSPSYRFGGFVPAFEARGFVHAGPAGTRRHVMRLVL
jgi:GNAT superfamily N-acetyltransferase